jgi:hypothetical protein
MPIDGRARVLGMEFGVGDLLLRYVFLLFYNHIAEILLKGGIKHGQHES